MPSSGGCRNIPSHKKASPAAGPAHSLAPLQGPGRRDECLCVSVAVCVLSSLCSVGGLLFLCIVTPLTVVETATPINSSQELASGSMLAFSFIANGNKFNGWKLPSTELLCPP